MEFHDIANIFPMMLPEDLDDLAQDIRINGLRHLIVTFEGKILDGRNRYRACAMAAVKPKYAEFPGTWEQAVKYVTSENLHRRHLTDGQRAMVAAKLAKLRNGQRSDLTKRKIESEAVPIGTASTPAQEASKSLGQAADELKVSRRSVARARTVQEQGVPELGAAVDKGEVSVAAAAEVVKLPKAEQQKVVAAGKDKIKEKAAEIRAAAPKKTPSKRDPTPEQVANRRQQAADDVLFTLSGAVQDARQAVSRIAQGQVEIGKKERELLGVAVTDLHAIGDWLTTLLNSGGKVSDADLNKLLSEGQN